MTDNIIPFGKKGVNSGADFRKLRESYDLSVEEAAISTHVFKQDIEKWEITGDTPIEHAAIDAAYNRFARIRKAITEPNKLFGLYPLSEALRSYPSMLPQVAAEFNYVSATVLETEIKKGPLREDVLRRFESLTSTNVTALMV